MLFQIIYMHRYIMKYIGKNSIYHINGNKLDNRIENLRIVTPYQNSLNKLKQNNKSSKYIGVYYDKDNKKWRASIKFKSKTINLGRFDNELEAAKCRDYATKKYFGDFGRYNIKYLV